MSLKESPDFQGTTFEAQALYISDLQNVSGEKLLQSSDFGIQHQEVSSQKQT